MFSPEIPRVEKLENEENNQRSFLSAFFGETQVCLVTERSTSFKEVVESPSLKQLLWDYWKAFQSGHLVIPLEEGICNPSPIAIELKRRTHEVTIVVS